jgi:anthranilate synthase component II
MNMSTSKKILVLDNYDSFTYNLVHSLRKLSPYPVDIYRNDEITVEEVSRYDKIVLSPGPGIPDEAGILKEVIRVHGANKSILGVCLGHQAIGEVFGAQLINMRRVVHGMATPVKLVNGGDYLFEGLPPVFPAGRYHSWLVDNKDLPACLEITSVDEEGQIMSLRHTTLDIRGVQFHPESVLTEHGDQIIANWLNHSA